MTVKLNGKTSWRKTILLMVEGSDLLTDPHSLLMEEQVEGQSLRFQIQRVICIQRTSA